MQTMPNVTIPETVTLRDLSLRDGLQMAEARLSTDQKQELIRAQHDAGVRHFEVGSFLPASRFPQFADVRELVEFAACLPGAKVSALVLNERGIHDALQTPLAELVVSVSASEAHSLANIGRPQADAVRLVELAANKATTRSDGSQVAVALSVVFGCSLSGEVQATKVLDLVRDCLQAGADTIAIADTVGYAGPRQVQEMSLRVQDILGDRSLAVHLHDTRGMGVANAAAALDAGVRILDGTLGGLGGCPFAPGASGNVAFEDLVYLAERSGYATGIHLEKLLDARKLLAAWMPNEPLAGALGRAGVPANIRWDARARAAG